MFKSRKEAVDAYQALYQERIDLEKEVALVKAREEVVKNWLQTELMGLSQPLSQELPRVLASAIGDAWAVDLVEGEEATLDNFDKLAKFIATHRAEGAFDLLYRRINQGSIRKWHSNGVTIPGLGVRRFYKLHHRRKEDPPRIDYVASR